VARGTTLDASLRDRLAKDRGHSRRNLYGLPAKALDPSRVPQGVAAPVAARSVPPPSSGRHLEFIAILRGRRSNRVPWRARRNCNKLPINEKFLAVEVARSEVRAVIDDF
jgi:hypothetical protein